MAVKWTPKMIRKLKAEFALMSTPVIAQRLGVSVAVVRSKAIKLGLKKAEAFILNGKPYDKVALESLANECRENSFKEVASIIGVPSPRLIDFLKKSGYYDDIKKYREQAIKKHKKILKPLARTKSPSPTPKHCQRKEFGESYWVACVDRTGAYKVIENNDPFDDRIFKEGRYFGTQSDALRYSRMICCRKR